MRILELVIDEEQDVFGIEAISLVEQPAIESDWIAMSKEKEFMFAEVDKEKRILIGAALIPDKPIYRRDAEDEYYVYFSKNTVRKAMEMFMQFGNQNNWTLEHEHDVRGLTVVESWLVEDSDKDKSRVYNLDVPVGTWMVGVKVNNEAIWNEWVKSSKVKGFSIEGFFVDKMQVQKTDLSEIDLKEPCWAGYEMIGWKMKDGRKVPNCVPIEADKETELEESYSDYPDGVKNNAKKVIEWTQKNGWGTCGTPVGKRRANQLANGEPISEKTIRRMANYLTRHAKDLKVSTSYSDGCGKLMYDAWGGKAALRWAKARVKEFDMSAELEVEIDLYQKNLVK
jgi:hypothetical protein